MGFAVSFGGSVTSVLLFAVDALAFFGLAFCFPLVDVVFAVFFVGRPSFPPTLPLAFSLASLNPASTLTESSRFISLLFPSMVCNTGAINVRNACSTWPTFSRAICLLSAEYESRRPSPPQPCIAAESFQVRSKGPNGASQGLQDRKRVALGDGSSSEGHVSSHIGESSTTFGPQTR